MNYITYNQLVEDTKAIARRLPNKYAGIIAVPRSGNIPANVFALHFNIPVYTINEFTSGLEVTTFTQRLSVENRGNTFLVVDDSTNTGERIKQSKVELSKFNNFNFEYACIYATDHTRNSINYFARLVPQPRVFEWNVFNHAILAHSCLDIDGVICPDPQPGQIDEVANEKGYIDYINNAMPMNIIKVPIKCFITSRMEKYRGITEAWLKKHGFIYEKLYMCQYKDAIERRRLNRYGEDKADVYKKTGGRLMIESNDWQARRIYEETGMPVLCTDSNRMYRRP